MAAGSLQGLHNSTPRRRRPQVLTSSTLDALADLQLSFKAEVFQRTGSFKIRGALNSILSLTEEEARRGVVTHSR